MLLTLLLDPHWHGMGESLARLFLGPFVLWFTYRWVRRGLRLVRSEDLVDKQTGWAFLVLALLVCGGFYWATRQPAWL
jgi:hypothetical protein